MSTLFLLLRSWPAQGIRLFDDVSTPLILRDVYIGA